MLGSNIFNGGLIIGIVAMLSPFTVSVTEIGTSLAFGIGLMLVLAIAGATRLNRRTGTILVVCYILSILTLLATARGH